MAMLTVNRAADSSVFVEESFWLNKSDVDRRVAERWRQIMPEDKSPPNMEHFLEFMALDLAESREAMVVAAQVHVTKSGGDGVVRVNRNEGQTELAARYLDGRDLYASIYGRKAAEALGFTFPTERVPTRLMRQVGTVLMNLKELPDEPIPAPKGKEELALKPSQLISTLEPPYLKVKAMTRQLVVETRKFQKTKKVKDEAYDRHVANFTTHAKCGEMLYRMAGMDVEASQVKPSTRRPGQREVVEGTSDEDAPDGANLPAPDGTTPAPAQPPANSA